MNTHALQGYFGVLHFPSNRNINTKTLSKRAKPFTKVRSGIIPVRLCYNIDVFEIRIKLNENYMNVKHFSIRKRYCTMLL